MLRKALYRGKILKSAPPELAIEKRWILHKQKQPCYPVGNSETDSRNWNEPDKWMTLDAALDSLETRPEIDGVSFVLGGAFCGIDLDNAIDADGKPREWAQQILDFCQSYSEISPSGTGYKIICRGELPENLLKSIPIPEGETREQIEHWNSGRHFCFTGERLEQYPAAIAEIDDEAFAEEVAKINPECCKPTKIQNQTALLNLASPGSYASDYREIQFIENRIQNYLNTVEFHEGNRNNQLNKKTWKVRGFCNSQGEVLSPREIARVMLDWNASQAEPLPEGEAIDTIESALKASPPDLNYPESRNLITSSPGVSKPEVNESADDWQAFKTFGPPAIQTNGQAPPMAEPVIDFILRRGETMNVIAASKEGKSWLAMGMACHLIAGTRWLQRFEAAPSRVLMIDNELHGATFDNRWLRVCDAHGLSQGQACKLNRILLRGKNQDITGIAAWLLNEINPGDFDVIVIDALYRTLPKGVSENDNADMMTIYNQLDEIAAALDCAVIIIHHSSKGNQGFKSVTDVGSGAGSISRAADTHLVIRPHKKDGYSVLDFRTRSFPPQDSLSIYFEFPKWLPSDLTPEVAAKQMDKRKAEKDSQDLQKIVELFRDEEKFTISQVRKKCGWGDTRCSRIVRLGVESEAIEDLGQIPSLHRKNSTVDGYKISPLPIGDGECME